MVEAARDGNTLKPGGLTVYQLSPEELERYRNLPLPEKKHLTYGPPGKRPRHGKRR